MSESLESKAELSKDYVSCYSLKLYVKVIEGTIIVHDVKKLSKNLQKAFKLFYFQKMFCPTSSKIAQCNVVLKC